MAPTQPKQNKAAAAPPTHLVISALQPGFRRAGRAWPLEETTVPVEEFSAEQVEALLAEPLLSVKPLVVPAGK